MIIRADLHTHTEKSFDGRQSLAALAAAAKAKGLQAVAVTDHANFSELPEEQNGILLIPGCEFFTPIGHMTGLFLEQQPRTEGFASAEEVIEEIHRCGGIAVLAHPFQKPGRKEEAFLLPLDGVETANARADFKVKDANEKATAFAQKHSLSPLGGSDAHSASEVGNAYTELDCDTLSREALKAAILQGRCRAILQKHTTHLQKGLSIWERRRRTGGIKNICIGLLYLCKCILDDLLK